jgi:hypothetical protein
MKSLLTGILFLFGFIGLVDTADEIVNAVKAGKATELVKYFDAKVSVKIIDQEDVISRSQAEANLRYFFEKHPVKSFTSAHKSSVNNSSQYITGRLETSNGIFRVSILIRNNLVTQFRIETDNE